MRARQRSRSRQRRAPQRRLREREDGGRYRHSSALVQCRARVGFRWIGNEARMKINSILAVATVALALCALTASASAGTLGGGWVATHTQALSLTGQLLGAAPADQQIEISAVLPLRNTDAISSTIESGQILTPDQVAAQFGPTSDSVNAVEAYLNANGFTNVSASSNGLLVTGNATVGQAEQAFDTTI